VNTSKSEILLVFLRSLLDLVRRSVGKCQFNHFNLKIALALPPRSSAAPVIDLTRRLEFYFKIYFY